jgi:uncharacterized membrane protein SpoIIM required for sporulation
MKDKINSGTKTVIQAYVMLLFIMCIYIYINPYLLRLVKSEYDNTKSSRNKLVAECIFPFFFRLHFIILSFAQALLL